MKKRFALILVLALALCLCACKQATITQENTPTAAVFTFPEGSTVLGVNVAGLNRSDAWAAFENAVNTYTMQLSVDGAELSVSSQEIGLTCSKERFEAIADAYAAGAEADTAGLIGFNEGKLRALLNEHFNKPVTEASLAFDEAAGSFVLIPDAIGQLSNPNALLDSLRSPILNLEAQHTLTDVSEIVQPTILDEDEAVIQALEKANAMNAVALTYTFTAEEKTSTHEIPADILRTFISLGQNGVTPDIDRHALESYVAELSETYSASSTQGDFRTTGGGTVGLTVSYNGVYVDQEALADDIATCILEGTSGTRTAPYQSAGIRDMPYGGTYIEVNLDAQRLYFYKYGECILSTNFVSGKVSAGWYTPNGVFAIYAKDADAYLVGEDYRTFVNYWMPFYGGYGLHDATWRGSFGGDIYVYNGSHGCVNLPLSSAATIFNNAPVGTKVIVYGGRRSAPPQAQSLGGTTSYNVADDTDTITLNISPRYGSPKMSYSSSNSSVATVSSSGVVTIKGVGSATITVSVPATDGYTSATTSVSITVHSACDDGRHKMGTPTVITPATCQPGKEKVSCTKCSHSVEQAIPAKDKHVYGAWTTVTAATCGAKGSEERICTTCNQVKETRDIPATGQHTPGSPVTTKEPNCTEKGTTETKCTVCGTVVATGTLDPVPNAHVPGELKVVNPTCTEAGYKHQKCTKCNVDLVKETLPPTGHSMTTETVNATCTANGYTRVYCTGCGYTESLTELPATGHSFSGGSCGNCGAADPDYHAPEPEA